MAIDSGVVSRTSESDAHSGGQRPKPSSEQIRERFSRQRRTGTGPELTLRRELHGRGWRYRADHPPLPDLRRRRADIVFTRLRVAIFVDGCFWHACPQHATAPKANADWWRAKLETNVARDRDTDARLEEAGWTVVRVWEHEPPPEAADRIEAVLRKRRRQLSSGST
ncbi:very short patch repair endonuclease [Nitriliruptoraceae bacterium ZYF776]|nr:very short patch repair endonuclease [Profundirhabdus halotolerans]